MATTILAGFNQLKSNLEITSLQKATVSTRQQNVRNAVSAGLDVMTSFLSGSYARSTMISPLKESDVDIFVILDPKYFKQYTPAQLLDRLRTILLKTYTKSPKISRNGHAVTITFTDFTVDVVPGFYRQGGGYLIPDSIKGNWIATDPTINDSLLSNANSIHCGNLIPLIKMIKGWNRCINDAFTGFYLELLTNKVLTNVSITDYPSGVRWVFDKGRESVRYLISDPAGFGDQVGGFNTLSRVDDAISRFETAYNRAIKAEQFAAKGNIADAFAEWQKVFPRFFPSYG